MDEACTFVADLARAVAPPAVGFASRAVYSGDRLKAIAFQFAAGAEMTEHTAPFPAIMHVLSGEGEFTLGSDRHAVAAGSWVHMPAKLPHSITARTPMTMLLLLLK